MEKEYKSLSESIRTLEAVPIKAVKEFIRLLKVGINNDNCDCIICKRWKKQIDKLAGDELIK